MNPEPHLTERPAEPPTDLLAEIADPELRAMVADLMAAPPIHRPSVFWENYARLNIHQLQEQGLERFKTTVNQNYFNWTGGRLRDQRRAMIAELGGTAYLGALLRALAAPGNRFRPRGWSFSAWRKYVAFVHLFAAYAARHDRLGWLARLAEPECGTPLAVRHGGRLLSQDLCNSVLELNAALEEGPLPGPGSRILELGAGYGRVAYCALHQLPGVRYTIVDIAPALYIAQWYLGQTLPGRRVFRYRPFDDFEQVREEFEAAEIAFLLPHQAERLPDKQFDLFINISSLHEMTLEQIGFWFGQVERLCRGRFYTKQWLRQQNDVDGIVVTHDDYPVPGHWRTRYDRHCAVQPQFFEALYEVGA